MQAKERSRGSPGERGRLRRPGLLALALVLAGAVPLSAQEPAAPQSIQVGARLFRTQGCGECHAVYGRGGGIGPDLGDSPVRRSLPDLAAALWNHLPSMAEALEAGDVRVGRLEPWEAADLVAFLLWLDRNPGGGDARRGEELFTERECVRCHQVRGRGGVLGPDLDFLAEFGSPIQIAAALWNHGPKMEQIMEELGLRRPRLNREELADLIAFLQLSDREAPPDAVHVLPGRADTGEKTFRRKGCELCHRVRNLGGVVGPELGGKGYRDVLDLAAALWNATPGMIREMRSRGVEPPRLSGGEMADLVAFFRAGGRFEGAGDARAGERVARRRGCLDCHGLGGARGGRAGDLQEYPGLGVPSGVVAMLWNHLVEARDELVARSDAFQEISPGEMSDLIAFLLQLGGGK